MLAGGQSLVPLLSLRLARPAHLVDINRLNGPLSQIGEPSDGGLSFGALVRQRAAERSSTVRERSPLVAEALPHIGHHQIRNRGTICGNLAHADPASELPAIAVALDGEMVVESRARGQRTIQADDFFRGYLTTALASDELLTEFRLPAWPSGAGWSFQEVSRRHGDYALVGVAALVQLDASGTCTDARLAFTGAAPGPVRAREAEAALQGRAIVSRCDQRRGRARGRGNRSTVGRPRHRGVSTACGGVPDQTGAARGGGSGRGEEPGMNTKTVELTVNGQQRSAEVEVRKTLADFLRDDLGLTGTHLGCEHGVCGSCTVLVDGDAVRSCLMLAVQADGAEVLTIEGLAAADGTCIRSSRPSWRATRFSVGSVRPASSSPSMTC